jgi:hypothetical protein
LLGAATILFAGFAQTYFLKVFFGTPSLYPLLHAHGFVMTAWFLLFGAQNRLASSAGRRWRDFVHHDCDIRRNRGHHQRP